MFYKTPEQYSYNCQGHEKQGKSEKLSELRGIKETWWQNVMWFSRWVSGTKGISQKLGKYEWSVGLEYQYWFTNYNKYVILV